MVVTFKSLQAIRCKVLIFVTQLFPMKKLKRLLLISLTFCTFPLFSQNNYEWAFDCPVDDCYDFYEGRAIARQGREKGFIDQNGSIVVEPQYHVIDAYTEGVATAGFINFSTGTSQSGFVNKGGEMVIRPQFEITSPFREGLACVKVNDQWGFVDKKGNYVVPLQYEAAQTLSEGLAGVKNKEAWGFIGSKGSLVIPHRYELALPFHEGLSAVKYNGKWGYLRPDGQFEIQPRFSYAGSFVGGLARVELNGKWGLIDLTGRFLIEPTYEMLHNFSHGLARAKQNGRWGFIDRKGKFVIAPQYEKAGDFYEQLARVYQNGAWGYIKPSGEVVIGFIFQSAYDFRNGLARVILDGKKGYIRYKESLEADQLASKPKAKATEITKRKIKTGRTIKVSNKVLILQLFDHKRIDGDIISLNFNGEWILDRYKLAAKPHDIQLQIEDVLGENYLMVFANNEGREPPNTVAVNIIDGEEIHKVILNSDLETCDIIYFEVKK